MKSGIPTLMVFALLMFACGDDEDNKEPANDGGDQVDDAGVVNGTGGTTGGSGGSSGSGGSAGDDSTAGTGGTSEDDSGGPVVDPDMDGGSTEDGSVDGDGSAAEDADQEDTGSEPIDLPDPGERLALCTDNAACTINTDDLTCYRAANETVGFCTEDCMEDSNCQAIDGLTATCANGACVVTCEDADDTNCPENMQCLPTRPRTGVGFACGYSEDIVQPTQGLFDMCSLTSECSEDLVCYRPGQSSGSAPGNSYCTNECEQVEDCESPQGVTVVMQCSPTGRCRILCDATDDCPDGMECQQIEGGGERACWYP